MIEYFIGAVLSFVLIIRIIGKHQVFGYVDPELIIPVLMLVAAICAFAWPLLVLFVLGYWHIVKYQ